MFFEVSKRIALSLAMMCCAGIGFATADADEGEMMDNLRRKTPSGQYIDPASFFRFHGYVSLSYTEADEELGAGGGTPNILVSGPGPSARTGENGGGFRNDAALFVGGEPFENVGAVIEIHFVGDASDPVITEAKMTWDLRDSQDGNLTFRLVGGRYWWPFGIHNDEWFSAVNRFSLLSPTATEVVPAHYNEVGLMGEGELKLKSNLGLNYAVSIGNGVPGFGLMGNVRQTGADANGDRTLTGRVGLVCPHGPLSFQIGLSVASGQLRDTEAIALDAADPDRYESDFTAFGPDLTLKWNGVGLRSYYYTSTEELNNAPVNEIARDGFTLEPSYTISQNSDRFQEIMLLGRYSVADEEDLGGNTYRRTQLGVGVNAKLTSSFVARLSYMAQGEDDDLNDLDNNALTISVTNEF